MSVQGLKISVTEVTLIVAQNMKGQGQRILGKYLTESISF